MTELTHVVLETETALPIEVVGWVVLFLSLALTVGWLYYVYR